MDGISSYHSFLAVHKPQLVLSGVPEHFWPTLCKKLRDQIFDSFVSFTLVRIDYEEDEKMPYDPQWSVLATRNIKQFDPINMYLIDHAWTFKANSLKHNLRNLPQLLDRMCNLLQVTEETDDKIDKVSRGIWKYANTYALDATDISVEDRVPVWYVLDELGSGITHSDNPNFRTVPFIYLPDQVTFTLLFPIADVQEGEFVTRDFVEGSYSDPLQREAMLIPWKHYNYFDEEFAQQEPPYNYFIEGHITETLPNLDLLKGNRNMPQKLKVFSEYRFINEYLTTDTFEIVDNEEEADILWYTGHFKTYKELSEQSPNKFVNQFPFEYIVTIKDLIAIVARRCTDKSFSGNELETSPIWLPTTFNLRTELPKLVAYYMKRRKRGLDNHWICKPYNLARGLDTYITDNLDFLCRLPLSGPKIAQKYIENPVLFDRPNVGLVKFDIRYVIILKSVSPLDVHIYNHFFLRFSNKPFALNNFDDYEQHFTVMNYTESAPLYRLLCEEFKREWANQYANYDWVDIEKLIFNMLSELFTAATNREPPYGIANSPQSRALYAVDLMLSWHTISNGDMTIQPKLLEINWMPDCRRACEYYSDFYNDIFAVMFLNKQVSTCTKIL